MSAVRPSSSRSPSVVSFLKAGIERIIAERQRRWRWTQSGFGREKQKAALRSGKQGWPLQTTTTLNEETKSVVRVAKAANRFAAITW
jgi:hypothetical protein